MPQTVGSASQRKAAEVLDHESRINLVNRGEEVINTFEGEPPKFVDKPSEDDVSDKENSGTRRGVKRKAVRLEGESEPKFDWLSVEAQSRSTEQIEFAAVDILDSSPCFSTQSVVVFGQKASLTIIIREGFAIASRCDPRSLSHQHSQALTTTSASRATVDMSPYKSFAVVGAGQIGLPIVGALAALNVSVIVLSRPGSSAKPVPAGVEIIQVDYDDAAAVFGGVQNGTEWTSAGVGSQKSLADAGKRAGAQLFVPSEYAAPTDGQPEGSDNPVGGTGAKNYES
ncbi:hypothetical protein C8F04DRAFT_1239598 [Mycena alexandri]|uniref:NmrA-like domain-containing protein n=1 Tax=Mycena alexandri TaxID=1745969 RepID=A0AAD6SCN6_9AGAR|nr:hypothetical protein C8F04DRAFT_1239598 [Mycena alexandri]